MYKSIVFNVGITLQEINITEEYRFEIKNRVDANF